MVLFGKYNASDSLNIDFISLKLILFSLLSEIIYISKLSPFLDWIFELWFLSVIGLDTNREQFFSFIEIWIPLLEPTASLVWLTENLR